MNGQNTIDSLEMLVIGLAVLLVGLLFIPNMISPNFYVGLWMDYKTLELSLVTPILNWVAPDWSVTNQLVYFQERLEVLYPEDVNWNSVIKIEHYSLIYRWPLVVPVLYLLWKSLRYKPENKGMLDFDALIELQTRQSYRFNRHLIKHNPQQDPDLDATKGIYAQRQKPLDYALKHQILTLSHDVTTIEEKKFDFHPERAKEVMIKQLGQKYQGLASLNRAERWMLAAFLIWLDMRVEDYHNFLGDISCAMSHDDEDIEKRELSAVDEKAIQIINSLKDEPPLNRVVRSNLSTEVIGSDTATVIRDLVEALSKFAEFEADELAFIEELYPNEWQAIKTTDHEIGLPFLTIDNVTPGFIVIAYIAIKAAADGVVNAKMEIEHLSDNNGINHDALDEFIDNAGRFILTHMDHSPAHVLATAINSHNYTKGVLLRIYRMCGDLGVICASRFTFIKLVDRELFFTLLDEGMPEGSIEVSFSRAHFDAEIEAGRKLKEPEVEHQIDAIRNRLLERVDLADD